MCVGITALTEDEVALAGVVASLHVPKAGLQPAPQYAVDFPQYPYLLQQFPKEDFKHVCPLGPPQLPSMETFLVTWLLVAVQVPNLD